jgi:maleate isomerase
MDRPASVRIRPGELLAGHRVALATITPSANTVVERVTLGILRDFPEVSAHFARTEVVGDKDPFPDSYDWDSMLGAARLLAHARPDVLAWNGSKAGGIDFGLDRELVRRIAGLTDAKSTTSTLAIDEVLRADGVKRFGLVSPYLEQYNRNIAATFAREGYECVAEAHSGLADNFSFSRVSADAIAGMLRTVAKAKPAAILTYCTNFPAAPLVAEMEDELGIPIYDTTTMAVWGALRLAGVDTRRGRDWGRVFER